MKEIIYNYDNLTNEDMNDLVIRTKALIINDENKILIGNENSKFQFPGGHLENNESLTDCLKREIKEETGIEVNDSDIKGPFMKITYLNRNHPKEGINRKNEIYYYIVKTNKKVNLSNTNYTDHEKETNFKIEEFYLDEAIDKIKENMPNNEMNRVVSPDMIYAIEEYLNRYR